MPRYKTSQEWLEQSALLLQARPKTTRITTSYSIKPAKARSPKASSTEGANSAGADTPMSDAKPPRGALVLKTFDPVSGVTLKYRTTKAAEVSRLVLALGKLGRNMAALPELMEEVMDDAPALAPTAGAAGKDDDRSGRATPLQQQQGAGQGAGGGGGGASKKKKKGKK